MSYDLAVWEGRRPSTRTEAANRYRALYDENIAAAGNREPTPAIAAYVRALLVRWPDITDDAGEDSPWSDGPLLANARGPIVYFGMVFSRAEEAAAFAAETAAAHGLNCFDPQTAALRPVPRGRRGRSPSPGEERLTEREGARRVGLALAPALEQFGFRPQAPKPRPPYCFAARRARGDLGQWITLGHVRARTIGLAIAVEHQPIGEILTRVLEAPAPQPLLEVPLHACWFGRFYAVREGDRGEEILDTGNKEADRDFDFEYAVCHASCVERAVADIVRVTRSFALLFFDRLDTLARIEAWWNAPSWSQPWRKGPRTDDPARQDFRSLAAAVPPDFLGAALAGSAARPDFRARLTALERRLRAQPQAPYPFRAQPQARRFLAELRRAFGRAAR